MTTDQPTNCFLQSPPEFTLMQRIGARLFPSRHTDCPELPDDESDIERRMVIAFQNGPIKEAGVNGISGEALLAIVIDRLRSFQAGPYASNENMHALTHATQCLEWLQKRTKDRLARGVEGTNQQ